ncbi:hypothetical protein SNEBB_001634 [Seison nebaliae]|nr:hypothetical protein SNEBB_001634 [Seison nebaliae]
MNRKLVGRLLSLQRNSNIASSSNNQLERSVNERISSIPLDIELGEEHYMKRRLEGVFQSSFNKNVEISRLSSGMKLATLPYFGEFTTFGVLIEGGPKFEHHHNLPIGTSHAIEKLAFSSSKEFGDHEMIMNELEECSSIVDCQVNKESIIYALSCRNDRLKKMIRLLLDCVYRPLLTMEELETIRMSMKYEMEDLQMRSDPEITIMELMHNAAFGGTNLGRFKYCQHLNDVNKIDRSTLLTYLSRFYLPERMTLTFIGGGNDHNAISSYIEEIEDEIYQDRTWKSIPSIKPSESESSVTYSPDIVRLERNMKQHENIGIPELTHIVMGLEAPPLNHSLNFVTVCLITNLLGGGGSFSAGGPGKGMYSRLYRNILNRHHWMFRASAHYQPYKDSSLFCIHSAAPPSYSNRNIKIIGEELAALGEFSSSFTKEELMRAKAQVKSMMLMNFEQRPVLFEDIIRQVALTSQHMNPTYYVDMIDSLDAKDIENVTREMLKKRPAIGILATDPYRVPISLDQLTNLLQSKMKKFHK